MDYDDDEPRQPIKTYSRHVKVLSIGLLLSLVGLGAYAWHSLQQEKQIKKLTVKTKGLEVRAPGLVQTYKLKPSATLPSSPSLELGWPDPPELLELHIDMADSRFNSFQVTVDKRGQARILQIRRMGRDSNGALRLALNSSAFGPGQYEVKLEGYNVRGELADDGWLFINLR